MFYGVFHFFFFFFLYIYIYIYVKYSLSQSVGRLCATLYFEHSCIFFPSGFIFVTRKLEVQSVEFTSKGKVFPLQAQCGPEGGRGIALLFHDSGTRRGEWSAACPGHTLPPGKTWYPLYRRLGGPQGQSGWAENLVPTGIRSWTVQPVVSHYTD